MTNKDSSNYMIICKDILIQSLKTYFLELEIGVKAIALTTIEFPIPLMSP